MSDEENCRCLLEMTLGMEIVKVEVSRERSIVYHPEYRGVRLDVYAKDDHNTRFNVEMQVVQIPEPGKRARYYHSQIDMDLLLSGEEYAELPEVYVIFICDFDPFGKRQYCYRFENRSVEDAKLSLGDGSHTIFLSTRGENPGEVPASLVNFLKFVRSDREESERESGDVFVRRLQDSIRRIKASREMGERYMTFEELLKDERKAGFAEGRELGMLEGEQKGEQRGELMGIMQSVMVLLESKGALSNALKEHIQSEKDAVRLRSMLKLAAEAGTVEEFEEAIQDHLM